MNFITSHLLTAVTAAAAAAGNHKTLPILAHLLIDARDGQLTITGSDLETEIKATVPADIATPGSTCLSAGNLKAFAQNAAGFPITLSCTEAQAQLKARSRSKLNSLPADTYPSMPDSSDDTATTVRLDAAALAEAISLIEHCAARDDVRYYLNGLYIKRGGNTLTLVASDGHRLAAKEMDIGGAGGEPASTIMPIKAAVTMAKLFKTGDLEFSFNADRVQAKNAEITMTCKCIAAKYPDFGKILNQDRPLEGEIAQEELLRVLESAIITAGAIKCVLLAFDKGALNASSRYGDEESEAEAECDYTGEPAAVSFNAPYLLDAAKKIPGHIRFSMPDNKSAIVLQPRDKSVLFVIMPMRL